jgi:hypothetical protein
MRAGTARTIPIARHRDRRIDWRLSPLVTPRSTSARTGVQIGCAGVTFFVVYVTLQLVHALHRDPTVVAAIAPIPLFARFVAGAACALPAGLAIGSLVRDPERWLRLLPTLLTTAIALFVLTVLFFS